jgi:hypothetical protein
MKPTVGLTSFFPKINLCEKKRGSANKYRGFVLLEKVVVLDEDKKHFSLQGIWGRFLQRQRRDLWQPIAKP